MLDLTLNVLWSCCSSPFNLGPWLTSMAFSELSFLLWTLNFQVFFFFCYFLMFPIILYAFSTTLSSFFIFHLIFFVAFMTGWFTYFITVIVYFISISEYFPPKILPQLSVLFPDKFCQPTFLLWLHVTHKAINICYGVIAAVIYWSSSLFSMSYFFQRCNVNIYFQLMFNSLVF